MSSEFSVVVVGGGISGLASAIAYARQGAQVTVLEQADAITEVGAGLQISPNGAAVLRALGLEDQLREIGVVASAVVLRDYRALGDVTRLDLGDLEHTQRYYFVHRSDLIDLLVEAAREAGVSIRLLQQVDRVVPSPRPVVHLATGDHLTADLVIGADGVKSKVRMALNGADTPKFTGQVAWRAVVPNTTRVPAEARVYMGPGRHLVTYPVRGGAFVNIVAVQERKEWAEEGWSHHDVPASVQSAFADFGPEPRALLERIPDLRLWGLFRHPVAKHWVAEGVALVGDAAHPTLPFLAQGANMALEDAWGLAGSAPAYDPSVARLAQYQELREGRVKRVISTANRNAWRYHLKFPPLRAAAHGALRVSSTLAPKFMLSRFDWLYRYDITSQVKIDPDRNVI